MQATDATAHDIVLHHLPPTRLPVIADARVVGAIAGGYIFVCLVLLVVALCLIRRARRRHAKVYSEEATTMSTMPRPRSGHQLEGQRGHGAMPIDAPPPAFMMGQDPYTMQQPGEITKPGRMAGDRIEMTAMAHNQNAGLDGQAHQAFASPSDPA